MNNNNNEVEAVVNENNENDNDDNDNDNEVEVVAVVNENNENDNDNDNEVEVVAVVNENNDNDNEVEVVSKTIVKNANNKIEITQKKRRRRKKKSKKTELDLEDEALNGVYSTIRDVIYQLIKTKGKWEGKVQKCVMKLVKEVIEFTEGFKYIRGKDKKELAMLVLHEIFTKELNESDMTENIKSLIISGIDYVIEPALEIALFAAKGNIQINKKKLNILCLLCKMAN